MAEKTRGYKTQFLLARDVSGIAIACISIRNVEVLDVFAKHLFYILLNTPTTLNRQITCLQKDNPLNLRLFQNFFIPWPVIGHISCQEMGITQTDKSTDLTQPKDEKLI